MNECLFAHLGGCDGRLVKAHLIPKQRIKRECPPHPRTRYAERRRLLHAIVWDERVWAWMCGGPTGIGGHHGAFDAKQIRLDRVPEELIEFARDFGLEWSLERDYGLRA